jgi:hypothetical protein
MMAGLSVLFKVCRDMCPPPKGAFVNHSSTVDTTSEVVTRRAPWPRNFNYISGRRMRESPRRSR